MNSNKILAHVFASAMAGLSTFAFGGTSPFSHVSNYANASTNWMYEGSALRRSAGRYVDKRNLDRLVTHYAEKAVTRPIEVGQRVAYALKNNYGAGIKTGKGTVTSVELEDPLYHYCVHDDIEGVTVPANRDELTVLDEVNLSPVVA